MDYVKSNSSPTVHTNSGHSYTLVCNQNFVFDLLISFSPLFQQLQFYQKKLLATMPGTVQRRLLLYYIMHDT
jgi:hypothetical protein